MASPIQSTTPSAGTRPGPAPAPAAPPAPATPDWRSPEARARALLARLGKTDHPDAQADPIHALYQVAVDYQCSAHGYRDLYLHLMRT